MFQLIFIMIQEAFKYLKNVIDRIIRFVLLYFSLLDCSQALPDVIDRLRVYVAYVLCVLSAFLRILASRYYAYVLCVTCSYVFICFNLCFICFTMNCQCMASPHQSNASCGFSLRLLASPTLVRIFRNGLVQRQTLQAVLRQIHLCVLFTTSSCIFLGSFLICMIFLIILSPTLYMC